MYAIRTYHAMLGTTAIAAYLTGESGIIHNWLGYAVAAIIVFRLGMAAFGERTLGLYRFAPTIGGHVHGNWWSNPWISRIVMLAIAICLLGVTFTGIAMDGGRTLTGSPPAKTVSTSVAGEEDVPFAGSVVEESGSGQNRGEEEGPLLETHELFANLLIFLVSMHAGYLLLTRFPLARFMLFVPAKNVRN